MTWHPDIPEEYRNQIVTGDARELAKRIPDESIDLIFTDPVYDRIEDYKWLAETAARVLKPKGLLLCWSNGRWHYQNTKWLEGNGLNYRYTFVHVNLDYRAPMNGKIISKANRVLWLDVDSRSKLIDYVADGMATYGSRTTIARVKFRWFKSDPYSSALLRALSTLDAIVLDPFTGSGVTPACCKQMMRNFIAFEIDPDTAELARERVLNTQPPLFVPEPEQLMLGE